MAIFSRTIIGSFSQVEGPGRSTEVSHRFHHLPGMLVEIDGRDIEETEGIGGMAIFDAAKGKKYLW
jgi:hypothetical protein